MFELPSPCFIHHTIYENMRNIDTTSTLTENMNDLTGFQRDLLWAVRGLEEPHGLAIKEELEEYYNTDVHHGRLYPNLDALVDKGLVKKGQLDKRTNKYEATDRGYRELEARREWENEYVGDLNSVKTQTD